MAQYKRSICSTSSVYTAVIRHNGRKSKVLKARKANNTRIESVSIL